MHWNANGEFGALFGRRLAQKLTTVPFGDDLMTDGQAQSSPFADRFRCEKSVKDFGPNRFRNAGAVICNCNGDGGILREDIDINIYGRVAVLHTVVNDIEYSALYMQLVDV